MTCLVLCPVPGALAEEKSSSSTTAPIRLGVVDHRLVSRENWLKPWKAEWESRKIAERFVASGITAEVVSLDVLENVDRLRAYQAVIIRINMKVIDTVTNPPTGKAADLSLELSAWNASVRQVQQQSSAEW